MTTVLAGLSVGAVYALVTLGYNVVYIGSGTLNFAHSNLMTLGVFLAYWGLVQLGWSIVPVILVTAVIVALAAVSEERIAIRPVRHLQGQLVTMVGTATLITGIIEIVWGQQALTVPAFFSNAPTHLLGGAVLPDDLVLIGLAVVLTAALALGSRLSMTGLAALAASEDREVAQLRGINVRRVQFGVFALAGAIAGAVGPFLGPLTFASYTLPASLALIGFVALALGGYGSIVASSAGAFAIGLVQTYTSRYLGANYENLVIFAILIVVLLVVPNGLAGARRERMV
ncbi:MAG: putative branched-chain amino acid transporter integral rane subunit [Actinomycetia bacterium]|nr:putative branched-chain amino acid transporter integral rane subunit [Actinomycetes bacterium]